MKEHSSKKSIIYVAHPYSGLKKNEVRVAEYLKCFIDKYPQFNFFSPIHNFSYAYFSTDYERGLDLCLQFLKYAKELWVCGDWESSRGCRGEVQFAKDNGIPILFFQEPPQPQKVVLTCKNKALGAFYFE